MSRAFPIQQCEECSTDIGSLGIGEIPLCPDCHDKYLGPLWADDESKTDEEVA